jgi:hypothetical protein
MRKRYLEDDLVNIQKEMHLPSLVGIYDSELPNFKVTSPIIIRFGPEELASFLHYALLVCIKILYTENLQKAEMSVKYILRMYSKCRWWASITKI